VDVVLGDVLGVAEAVDVVLGVGVADAVDVVLGEGVAEIDGEGVGLGVGDAREDWLPSPG